MTTAEILAQELAEDQQEAQADLYNVLNELRGTFGMHSAQAAARAVLAAAKQGRLTGHSYGFVDFETGTLYGCPLGLMQCVVMGMGTLGEIPRPDFLCRDTYYVRYGQALESFISDVSPNTTDHPRSLALQTWLTTWLDEEALG